MGKKEVEAPKIKPIELKPMKDLEGVDTGADSFVCDLETGICGPAKPKKKETK